MVSELVKCFEIVQNIPYKVCPYERRLVKKNLSFGDCRHKSELLRIMLIEKGYPVRKTKVLFDWKDLPIPHSILSVLSSTKWQHTLLEVQFENKWIKVDCTWNPELEKLGFPVTKKWDGHTDTMLVTKGLVIPISNKHDKPVVNKDEAAIFANKLNDFLTQ